MSTFSRPALATLVARAIADIEGELPGADARVRRSNLNVLAKVSGGSAHGQYGYIDNYAKMVLVLDAKDEVLDRHARIWVPPGRKSADYAVGYIAIVGTPGATLEAGSLYKRADGRIYITDAEVTLTGTSAEVAVTAVEPGQAGNADAGVTLNLDSPVDGINAAATVTVAKLTGGTDREDDDDLLDRILERIQETPHGGAKHDYANWAKEVPGVTRAWAYPLEMGDGTMTVRFVRDDDADLIPDAAEVAAVQAHIETVCPALGELFVVAPIPDALVFQIRATPATLAVKAAIEASLRDVLQREAEPEGGDGEGEVLLTHLREAISLAAGETDHVLAYPTADMTPAVGHMVTFGGITWLP